MPETVFEKTMKAGTEFAESIPDTRHMTECCAEMMEEGMETARRAIKRGRHFAEDLIEDAEHQVKKYPLRIVAATFGVAFAGGALLGWLAARNR